MHPAPAARTFPVVTRAVLAATAALLTAPLLSATLLAAPAAASPAPLPAPPIAPVLRVLAAPTTTLPATSSTTTPPPVKPPSTSTTSTTVPPSTLPFAPRTPTLPSLPFASPTIAPVRLPLLVRTPRSYTADDTMVKAVQRALVFWGLRGVVDGWYGPQTEERVRRFQKRVGLPQTGTTTTATWRALGIRPA